MIFDRIVFLTVAFLGVSAFAQEASTQYDGRWSGTCGVPVDLEIHGQAGKWTPHANRGQTKNNPCLAYSKPVDVKSATSEQLVLKINGSEALQGCADVNLALRPIDATHLESARSIGSSGVACTLEKH